MKKRIMTISHEVNKRVPSIERDGGEGRKRQPGGGRSSPRGCLQGNKGELNGESQSTDVADSQMPLGVLSQE